MTEKLCLQWNDFKDNVLTTFGSLREDKDFADVTLACEDGKQVEAHKVILAASSPFFQNLLTKNLHPHPLIYMRGVKSEDLSAIVDFLYFGETNVFQENLDSFLAIAEELQLKGLMGSKNDDDVDQKKPPKMATPKSGEREIPVHKIGESVRKSSGHPLANVNGDIMANDYNSGTVALATNFQKTFQELDEKVNSMMLRPGNKNSHGQPIYQCSLCGKEAKNANLKYHIEANHLEGVAIPCNFCPDTFRSRKVLSISF